MKKIITLFMLNLMIFSFVFVSKAQSAADSALVTFQVDMSTVSSGYATPEVNGSFNSWCGNCWPMSDVNGDDIWEVSVMVLKNTAHEFKFSADNWAIQESLFSGLNNVAVYSFFREKYGQYFGFTEKEVIKLISETKQKISIGAIKEWYNGYQIGKYILYNPWSIISCLANDGALQPYWINTSSNALIETLLLEIFNILAILFFIRSLY